MYTVMDMFNNSYVNLYSVHTLNYGITPFLYLTGYDVYNARFPKISDTKK